MKYPTKRDLKAIEEWKCSDGEAELLKLLSFIESIWEYADIGFFRLTGKKILKLQLHTGGWSGNEEIIGALKNNKHLFWHVLWEK